MKFSLPRQTFRNGNENQDSFYSWFTTKFQKTTNVFQYSRLIFYFFFFAVTNFSYSIYYLYYSTIKDTRSSCHKRFDQYNLNVNLNAYKNNSGTKVQYKPEIHLGGSPIHVIKIVHEIFTNSVVVLARLVGNR